MSSTVRLGAVAFVLLALIAGPAVSQEGTRNLRHMGNSPRPTEVTQSDIAFRGNLAIAGSFDGFRIVDITNPTRPRQISRMHCNGGQGDVSVWGDLVFRSVDTPQSSQDCNSTNVTASTPGMFEGIQIFDISDVRNPTRIHSVPTDCGSHTHTLLPDTDNDRVFLYISSYPLGNAAKGPNCSEPHGYISIVEVPLSDPTAATVHKYFLDPATEMSHYDLDAVFGTPPGTLGTGNFIACHDISVFTELNLLAGACLSESQLWDISDPLNPQFLWRFDDPALRDEALDLWHSAAFSWDGKVVAFGDESGGGVFNRCTDPTDDHGRVWFLDVESGELLANYKIPRAHPEDAGRCTMHNFNFIPQKLGRYTLVSGVYTAGITVVNVNKLLNGASEAESEIAWARQEDSDVWSGYWYNGRIYATEHDRGLDVYLLQDGARATAQKFPYMNPQTQEQVLN